MKFEVGKKYKTTKENLMDSAGLTKAGQIFTVSEVDKVGDAWTEDSIYVETYWGKFSAMKKHEYTPVCVATHGELLAGKVVLVEEE